MLVGVSGLNHISSSRGPPKKLMPDSLTGSSTDRDWSKFQRQSVKPEKARHQLAAGKYRAAHGTDSTAQHSRLHLQTKHLGWTGSFFPTQHTPPRFSTSNSGRQIPRYTSTLSESSSRPTRQHVLSSSRSSPPSNPLLPHPHRTELVRRPQRHSLAAVALFRLPSSISMHPPN